MGGIVRPKGADAVLSEFPVIHTNIWDTFWAIPTIIILTWIVRKIFQVKPAYVSTVATLFGLAISIFISHRHNLSAGIFMGFIYGGVAVGTVASLKTSIRAYRAKE
jgi:hypothetical protein